MEPNLERFSQITSSGMDFGRKVRPSLRKAIDEIRSSVDSLTTLSRRIKEMKVEPSKKRMGREICPIALNPAKSWYCSRMMPAAPPTPRDNSRNKEMRMLRKKRNKAKRNWKTW